MSSDFYRAVAARLFATTSALVSGMVSLKLYSHYLSPESYGVVVVALQFMSYLPLLDGGFRTTTNRRLLAEPDQVTRLGLVRFCQAFYSLVSVAIVAVALLCMWGYAFTSNARQSSLSLDFFLVLGAVGAAAVIGFSQMNLLIGLQAQTALFLLMGLNSWLTVGARWICLGVGAGVWAFPLSSLAALAGTLPIAWRSIRRRMPSVRLFTLERSAEFKRYFHELKRDAWACFRSQVSIILLFTVDIIFVGMMSSAGEAAVYAVLSRLFGIVRGLLQTAGEAAWPVVAEQRETSGVLASFLLRANGWIYGAVMGAMALTLTPFLEWYMGKAWAPPSILVYLLAARFLITGASSPAGYLLVGLGDFQAVARCVERELVVATLLAVPLGMKWGVLGVAWAFLLATACGTFLPILFVYAKAMKLPPVRLVL